MSKIIFKINGKEVEVDADLTVLKAAKQVGIDIPTLCDHPALAPIGACRLCVVETKNGALQTACTLPVTPGLEVETESPKVVETRKFILNLLFSERNHYCMYCEVSGDCELQNLGYRYGIDHFAFSPYSKKFPTDFTHKYILLEHNRCVLCRRCVRACSEIAGHSVLGIVNRGSNSLLSPDMENTMKLSTCASCGTCVQVCPTGALADKIGAYLGKTKEMEKTPTTCLNCSVGCGVVAYSKSNQVIKIWGEWETTNKGVICEFGRYTPLYDKRKRITQPIIRKEGKREALSWDEAIEVATTQIKSAKTKGGLIFPKVTNEALEVFQKIVGKNTALLEKITPEALELKEKASLDNLLNAKSILLYKVDPSSSHGVIASWIKRAVNNGAKLTIVGDEDHSLSFYASSIYSPEDKESAINSFEGGEGSVVVYSPSICLNSVNLLSSLEGKALFLPIFKTGNSMGAVKLGLNGNLEDSDLVYILASDYSGDSDLLASLKDVDFLIVQANFLSPLTERADLILPSATWLETEGTITNLEGKNLKLTSVLKPHAEAKTDEEVLNLILKSL